MTAATAPSKTKATSPKKAPGGNVPAPHQRATHATKPASGGKKKK